MTSPKEQHPKDELTVFELNLLQRLVERDDLRLHNKQNPEWPDFVNKEVLLRLLDTARKGIPKRGSIAQRWEAMSRDELLEEVKGFWRTLGWHAVDAFRYNPAPPEQAPRSTCPDCGGLHERHPTEDDFSPVAAPDQEGVEATHYNLRSEQFAKNAKQPPSPQEPQLTNEDLAVGFAGIKDGKKITAAEFYEADRGEADIQQPQADVEALVDQLKRRFPDAVLEEAADLITALSKERDVWQNMLIKCCEWHPAFSWSDYRHEGLDAHDAYEFIVECFKAFEGTDAKISALKQENERLTFTLRQIADYNKDYATKTEIQIARAALHASEGGQ